MHLTDAKAPRMRHTMLLVSAQERHEFRAAASF